MYKIVYNSWKFLYVECIELKKKKNSFYIQNCVHCLKIVFLEFTKLKICIYWIFRIVYILKKNCVPWMYKIMYILWGVVSVECIELCIFF